MVDCVEENKGAHRIVFNGKQIHVKSHNTLAYAQLGITKVYLCASADVFWYALAYLACMVRASLESLPPVPSPLNLELELDYLKVIH